MSKRGAWAVDTFLGMHLNSKHLEPISDNPLANFRMVHIFNITFPGKLFISLKLLEKEFVQGQSPSPIYE